jgi:outer membrane protein TolC
LRLKAQVEISKLIEQLSLLEQRKLTAEARINSLLFREPETPLGKPEEIKPRDFTYGLAELNELALTNYPTLKAQRRKIDREQYGVELARKDFYPDFSMGFTYFNRPGMPEMYGVNVGVKIPIYFWQKQRPALAEATASAAAYNAGEARVQRIINTTGVRDFDELARRRLLPAETRNYVPAVLAAWSQISTAGTGMNNATAIQAQPRSVE